jgi:hypothetical protein
VKIRVECYAGYRGEQEPRAFWLGERRVAALEILDRWVAPEHRYFKVKADDGHVYILRRDEAKGEWTLGAFTHAGAAAAGRARPHRASGPE